MQAIAKQRHLMRGFLAVSVLVAALASGAVRADAPEVAMYKDPNCGCCGAWADHMRDNGFKVQEISLRDMAQVKRDAGVPRSMGSCHTAKVGGYIVEGHVPAADVRRLLAERPPVVGIAAPGMPLGSPGMEGPYEAERYDVISFDGDGNEAVFASH